ncbi:hypothetical protein ACFPJ4_07415 [Lysinimonas soli]|uniref:Uncharacterized protein n=1 Tax=Lysinimonas soli TaxID=1074233 RepID=A0ABW0NNE4_9MICO
MSYAPVEPTVGAEKPKGDPLKFGILLIVMGILADAIVVVIALLSKQPLHLLVLLPSLANFYTGVKYIRIGLAAKRSA